MRIDRDAEPRFDPQLPVNFPIEHGVLLMPPFHCLCIENVPMNGEKGIQIEHVHARPRDGSTSVHGRAECGPGDDTFIVWITHDSGR